MNFTTLKNYGLWSQKIEPKGYIEFNKKGDVKKSVSPVYYRYKDNKDKTIYETIIENDVEEVAKDFANALCNFIEENYDNYLKFNEKIK